MFHVYWLERAHAAIPLWLGWAASHNGTYREYPVTLTDLGTLPPTARVYVDGRRVRR